MEILGGKDAVAYAGPFVVDHNHALMQGLSLQNAIWSASPKSCRGGLPIVTAGNVPLLTEQRGFAGRHRLQMRFVADLSNLQDMPDWPILFANLVDGGEPGLPGVAAPNVRLGQTVAVVAGREAQARRSCLAQPRARRGSWTCMDGTLPCRPITLAARDQNADAEYQFSCNAVSRDESDLSRLPNRPLGKLERFGESIRIGRPA